MAKKDIHPEMRQVKAVDLHGHEFEVYTTSQQDFKVETSYLSHPAYNPDKQQKKLSLGRSDVIAKKMERMQAAQNKSS